MDAQPEQSSASGSDTKSNMPANKSPPEDQISKPVLEGVQHESSVLQARPVAVTSDIQSIGSTVADVLGANSNISQTVTNVSTTLGLLGGAISSAINQISETAIHLSKSGSLTAEKTETTDNEIKDFSAEAADSEQMLSVVDCRVMKGEAGQAEDDASIFPTVQDLSTEPKSMVTIQTTNALRIVIIGLASSEVVRDSILSLASSKEVKDSILALASPAAAGDAIFSLESVKNPAVSPPCKDCHSDSSPVTSPESPSREEASTESGNSSETLKVESVTESDLHASITDEPKGLNLLDGEPKAPLSPGEIVSVTTVEELQTESEPVIPNKAFQEFAEVLEESMRHQSKDTENKPIIPANDFQEFSEMLEESIRHSSKEVEDKQAIPANEFHEFPEILKKSMENSSKEELINALAMMPDETPAKSSNLVKIDSDASAFLATVKSSSAPVPSASDNVAPVVDSLSSIMVFGAHEEAPTTAADSNVHNWLKSIPADGGSRPQVDKEDKPKKKKSKTKSKKAKKSETRVTKETQPKDPSCGCICCKDMPKRMSIFVEDATSSECTSGSPLDPTLSVVLEEPSDITSSDYSKGDRPRTEEEVRMQDPKEWLKRAKDEFMRRECIRQVVLRHNRLDGDCRRTKVTRVSRLPASPSDSAAREQPPRVPEGQQLLLQIDKKENTIDYIMRVPKPCDECPCPLNKRTKIPNEACAGQDSSEVDSTSNCERNHPASGNAAVNSEGDPPLLRKRRPKTCDASDMRVTSKNRVSKSHKEWRSQGRGCAESLTGSPGTDFLRRARSTLGFLKQSTGSWLSDDVRIPVYDDLSRACVKS